MSIRPARPTDAAELADVHIRAWHETYRGIMPDKTLDDLSFERSRQAWTKRLTALPDRHFVAVAVDEDDKVVGFASAGPKRLPELPADGEIFAINLVREAKLHRFGAQLMHAAAQHLVQQGFESAGLWVLERNTSARAFYERLGGTVETRREQDFGGTALTEFAIHWPDARTLESKARALIPA